MSAVLKSLGWIRNKLHRGDASLNTILEGHPFDDRAKQRVKTQGQPKKAGPPEEQAQTPWTESLLKSLGNFEDPPKDTQAEPQMETSLVIATTKFQEK